MSYKNIRIEVDEQVYMQLLHVQKITERNGIKRSLATILLDFACSSMGLEQAATPDEPSDEQEQVTPIQKTAVSAVPPANKVLYSKEDLPEDYNRRERVQYIMTVERLDVDDMAASLGLDAKELAYELSFNREDDLDYDLISKVCKVYGDQFYCWWILNGY
jgi:hypothetical protein